MLSDRKQHLLALVVEHYIRAAEPIGSRYLTETGELQVSGATIRNELRALEEEGYLTHPHTSAGRIPTELGYEYYVQHILTPHTLEKEESAHIGSVVEAEAEAERKLKSAAKALAELSGNAVILAFTPERMYYTGMSQLFAQPEFANSAQTVQMSSVFDHVEERLPEILNLNKENLHILVGSNNPLGGACSTLALTFPSGALMLLLGPMRMEYKQNIARMQYILNCLS